jgi:hypothetical protein
MLATTRAPYMATCATKICDIAVGERGTIELADNLPEDGTVRYWFTPADSDDWRASYARTYGYLYSAADLDIHIDD